MELIKHCSKLELMSFAKMGLLALLFLHLDLCDFLLPLPFMGIIIIIIEMKEGEFLSLFVFHKRYISKESGETKMFMDLSRIVA